MKQLTFFPLATLFFACLACQNRVGHSSSTEPKLLSWFQVAQAPDTLHFEVKTQGEDSLTNPISSALLFASLDTVLLRSFEQIIDTSEAKFFGRERYAVDGDFDACLLDVQQFWFRYKMLLLFDKKRNAFTDLLTVAEWYGGDGGQILTGSWFFDYDGDGQKDLVLRQIEHSMHVKEDGEPEESKLESASLLLWKNGSFVKSTRVDSTVLVKRFPIASPF